MKKKIHILSVLLFISLLPMALFSSCDKDTNCYVDVLVISETTRLPVSGVQVVLHNYNDVNDRNYRQGITNEEGIFSTFFSAPAILSIEASYTTNEGVRFEGSGSARAEEGITQTATVILKQSSQK